MRRGMTMKLFDINLNRVLKIRTFGKETLIPPRLHVSRTVTEYIIYVITAGELHLVQNGEELILMPFTIDSKMCTMLTGFSPENDWIKAFSGDFDVTPKRISLDAEKALVHGMNPKYNRIRFKNYPFSKDGLYKSDASVFCHSIADNMILGMRQETS